MVLAHAESRRAAQALRSPHVSIGSSYNVRTDEQSVVIPSPAPLASPTTFPFVQDEGATLGGLVNVPLYTSGRIASAIDAAQCAEASAEEVVQSIHLDLKLAVAASFLAVLESKQMLHTAEKSLQSLKTHLANVEQLHGSDVAPLTDLLDARAAVANARQRHLSAGNELLLAEAEYNRRVGRPLTSPVSLQEPSIENVSGDLQSLLDAARGKRSELARIDFEAEALRNKAESIEATNRPHVFLGGTYWFEENRYRTPEGIGTLGVTALWNIYDGRHNAYQGAAYLQEAAALKCRRSGLSQEIELEIHRAWLKRAEHLQLIEETAEAVRLAEENANNVQQRYRVGMATNAEVLAAETTRIQSLERLHRARYGAILAELKLRRAAGIL
jgi:outer membrane protein TolC